MRGIPTLILLKIYDPCPQNRETFILNVQRLS